jgi:hypothetical protein
MSSETAFESASAQGPLHRLRGCARGLRCVSSEVALYGRPTSVTEEAPAGWSSRSHAATRHSGSDAATEIDCRTPVCRAEIPDLWTSAIPPAWRQRSANGDQFRSHGLQLETDDQRSRRVIAGDKACAGLKSFKHLRFKLQRSLKNYLSTLPPMAIPSFVTASYAVGSIISHPASLAIEMSDGGNHVAATDRYPLFIHLAALLAVFKAPYKLNQASHADS